MDDLTKARMMSGKLTVYFDDACPLCRREIGIYRLHVRDADGKLTAGTPAFVALWRALPGFAFLARLASAGPVQRVMEVAYAAFLRLRPLWRAAKKAPPRPTTQPRQP